MKKVRNKQTNRIYCRYRPESLLVNLSFIKNKQLKLLSIYGPVFIKRVMDILISVTALLLLSPMMILVAFIIKLTDRGPVFYRQTRIGKWGQEFLTYKFRSMIMNADKLVEEVVGMSHHENSISYKVKNDPRVTAIGRFIRKASIDELPQLLNVIKGDMSLVGPRPHVQREIDQYSLDDRRRLDVTPGITCIWQISGRADIPFPEQLKLDVQYIETRSIWMDIKILFKTIPAVISAKGAY